MQGTHNTLRDKWAREVLTLTKDSLLMGTRVNRNHSLAGRGGPNLGLCMGKLPKTQVSGNICMVFIMLSEQKMYDLKSRRGSSSDRIRSRVSTGRYDQEGEAS